MPKKTFYLSEADLPIYEKAKAIAGDSISSVFLQSMKDLVVKWEKQELGFNEEIIFEGKEYYSDSQRQGQLFKFIGKLLSKVSQECGAGVTNTYKLYLTRKGKFLLHIAKDDVGRGYGEHQKIVVNDMLELKKMDLPDELLIQAGENMPDLFIETLDI
jgi:hypothetical protein